MQPMHLRVEVLQTVKVPQPKKVKVEDKFVEHVREADIIFGRLLNYEGHGKHGFYWVIDRAFKNHKVSAQGGGWPVSGTDFVRIDLDHPVHNGDEEGFELTLGMRIGFEPVAEGEVSEVWAPWDAIKVVREVQHHGGFGYCAERVTEDLGTPSLKLVEELTLDMIESGTFPEDGVARLREQNLLTQRIKDCLKNYGIPY